MHALLNPAFWASALPLVGVYAVSRHEIGRRRLRALPYLGAYSVAGIFSSVFITFALAGPKGWKAADHYGFLAVTAAVLVVGLTLHRLTVRQPLR